MHARTRPLFIWIAVGGALLQVTSCADSDTDFSDVVPPPNVAGSPAAGSAGDHSNGGGDGGLGGAPVTSLGGAGADAGAAGVAGESSGGEGGSSGATTWCGDGRVEGEEQCDDGNRVTEACTYGAPSCLVCDADCASTPGAVSYCGDAVTDTRSGEACDDGNIVTETCDFGQKSCQVCDGDCQLVSGLTSFCGDSAVDALHGEACDDGNVITETCAYGVSACTVCDAACQSVDGAVSFCGDGVTDAVAGESCDDGNAVTDLCTYGATTCTVCTAKCKTGPGVPNYCGDSSVNAAAGETCDDGNESNLDACSNSCKSCGGIPGLSSTNDVTNTLYANAGLAFTATAASTLYQFTYNHQGRADTITLAAADGTVVGSVTVPAKASNPLVVDVNWSLKANVAYRLTTGLGLNQRFALAPAGTFPAAAAGGIRVDSSWIPSSPGQNKTYWLVFTNLRSCLK